MSLGLIPFLAQESKGPGSSLFIIYIVLIVGVFYFLIMRPQKKKEQKRRAMINEVRKGDRIVTIGGIHGEIISAKDDTIIILVDAQSGTTLKMTRGAIHRVVNPDADSDSEE